MKINVVSDLDIKHLNFIGRHTSTNECIPRTSHLTKKIRQERSPSIIDFTNLSLPESWITSEILRTFGRYLARRTHLRSSEAMSTIMARPRHSTHAPTLSGTVPPAAIPCSARSRPIATCWRTVRRTLTASASARQARSAFARTRES